MPTPIELLYNKMSGIWKNFEVDYFEILRKDNERDLIFLPSLTCLSGGAGGLRNKVYPSHKSSKLCLLQENEKNQFPLLSANYQLSFYGFIT